MGLNERIGHKKANFVRLGLKTGAVLGAVAGVSLGKKKGEAHFEEYKQKEHQRQREENVATFAGIAQDRKGLAQPVSQSGEEILKKFGNAPNRMGQGLVPPAPPPPPSAKRLAGRAIGVAVGQASLKDELVSAGQDYYQRSLSREEADAKFRAEQAKKAQGRATGALGGAEGLSAEAGVKDLARIGGRKIKKAVPNLNPLRFVR